jgi:hypothetical protein
VRSEDRLPPSRLVRGATLVLAKIRLAEETETGVNTLDSSLCHFSLPLPTLP